MESQDVITIALIDDHKLFREGVKRILSFEPMFEVVAEADDGLEAKEIVDEHQPDIVLMDINMPEMNGIEATKELLQNNDELKIIILWQTQIIPLPLSSHPIILPPVLMAVEILL